MTMLFKMISLCKPQSLKEIPVERNDSGLPCSDKQIKLNCITLTFPISGFLLESRSPKP